MAAGEVAAALASTWLIREVGVVDPPIDFNAVEISAVAVEIVARFLWKIGRLEKFQGNKPLGAVASAAEKHNFTETPV